VTTRERGDIKYFLLFWATGNGTNSLVDTLQVKKTGKLQRIATNRRLRAIGTDDEVLRDVYALGDSADIEGYTLPTLAEVAVQKAKYLAKELNAGEQTGQAFHYKQKPNVAYLGQHDGVIGGREEWTGKSWLGGVGVFSIGREAGGER
jgi:NADH:ubiquinone reductase (non-electrogenic)